MDLPFDGSFPGRADVAALEQGINKWSQGAITSDDQEGPDNKQEKYQWKKPPFFSFTNKAPEISEKIHCDRI
jgi:hypothetical protein